jgi:predicted AAA+ superfamily ATPase
MNCQVILFGIVWEQIVVSNLKGWYPEVKIFYYRTAKDSEVDFVVKINNRFLSKLIIQNLVFLLHPRDKSSTRRYARSTATNQSSVVFVNI